MTTELPEATGVLPDEAVDARPAAAESRGERALFRFTLLMTVVTAVLTVGTPLLGLKAMHSVDLLQLYHPWHDTAPTDPQPANKGLTDVVDVMTPMQADARRQVRDGHVPMRSAYPSGGMSLGTVANWGVLGPFELPKYVLPLWFAAGVVKLLELLVAAGLTFLFLRTLGMGRAAAMLGGLLFMNTGFMLNSTNWPHAGVTALIPGIFWGVERAIQRGTVRSALPLAAVTAASLLQGYPSVTGYALFFAAVYAVVRVFGSRGGGPLATAVRRARSSPIAAALSRLPGRWVRLPVILGVGVALGIGLAAFQILPFAKELDTFYTTNRIQNAHRIIPLRGVVTMAIPNGLGLPGQKPLYAPRNYAENHLFVGAAAVVLILLGLARIRRDRLPRGALLALWGVTIACFQLIYYGGRPLRLLQVTLPQLFGFNFVGRLRSVLGFLLACLAGIAFQAFVDRPPERRRWWRTAVVVVGSAALVGYAYARLWGIADDFDQLRYLVRQSVLPFVATAIALLALALAWRAGDRRRVAALVMVPAIAMVESVAFANGYIPRIDKDLFYPVTSTHQYVLDHVGHERTASAQAVLDPGTTTYYGIRTVSAHGFHHKHWHDMLLTAGSRPRLRSPTLPLLLDETRVGVSPILDRLSAKFWLTPPGGPYAGAVVPGERPAGTTPLVRGEPRVVQVSPRAGLRAVTVRVTAQDVRPEEQARLRAEALDASGAVVGAGARRLFPGNRGDVTVPIVQPDPTVTAVRLSWGGARPLTVAADAAARPALSFVVDDGDGLRPVFVGGAVVYLRTRALPRVRWASRSLVERDPQRRLDVLSHGLDADTVLLGEEPAGPPLDGATAKVALVEDAPARMRVRVDAGGDGYLVVADAMQHGWTARVDGRPAKLVEADHALVGVRLGAGSHEVRLDYDPPGWRTGVRLSWLSLLAVLLIALQVPTQVRRLRHRL